MLKKPPLKAAAFSPSRHRPKVTMRAVVPRPSRSGTTEATTAGGGAAVSVRVCVRVRPSNEREAAANRRRVVDVVDDRMIVFDPKHDEDPFFYQGVQQPQPGYMKRANKQLQFMFDRVFDERATNETVFAGSTRDVIDSLMEGYNCSVFVYGATGAGKTYTMLGHPAAPGITYLTMQELFARLDSLRVDREFEICVSYLEIYNENVHDLLRPSGPLHLREDGKFGVQIAGLFIKSINTAQELIDMLDKGNKNRTQHPTDANSESSRSHAVFQVYIKMRTKASSQTKIVKLSMIDLAGSERASATGCKGDRFKEGANINRSLLALGNCINQLADGSKFIPYRDSKLTRLLKDSLGGNCRTVMIANVGPTCLSYEDTYNTLKYATRASKIKQKMKKNIISCDNHVAQYIKQTEELLERVAFLEAELAKAKEKERVCVAPSSGDDIAAVKWNSQLKTKAEEKFSLIKVILKNQKKQRSYVARAARKRRAAIALSLLCGDVPDSQLKDACHKDITRLQLSSKALMKQAENLQVDLHPLIGQSTTIENEFKALQSEASTACKATNATIAELTYRQQYLIAHEKAEHLEVLSGLQQDEIGKLNDFMKDSLIVLKKNYIRLKSQGMFTSSMKDEYNTLIRQAKNSRAVTWEDNDEGVDCEDPHFKYSLHIDPCAVESIPQFPDDDLAMSPAKLSLEDESEVFEVPSEVAAHADVLNVTYTEESDVKVEGDKGFKRPNNSSRTIDPSLLNSTFNIIESLDGEPSKKFQKLPQKFVLSERTNKPPTEKVIQAVKPSNNKVIPFKKPIVVNALKENKSGFGSSADRFHITPAGQGYKALRGKERLALAGSALPYTRPTPIKSEKK